MSITDLLKDSDIHEHEHQNKAKPDPKRTVHTLMGDIRRWNWLCGNFPLTSTDYELLRAYYNEKEGIKDE